MHSKRLAKLMCLALAVSAVAGASAASASASQLAGAGSTLVAPIEAEWGVAWAQANGLSTPSYASIGSGGGLAQIGASTVDFGASDAPISASTSPCSGCIQLPWALSATGVSFNIPGVRSLRLTGRVLADIYLKNVTNWNAAEIRRLNPGKRLPNLGITPVHRSDGSGDSYAFTDYLTSVSNQFARTVGRGTKPSFPAGEPGAAQNIGMVNAVQSTPGSIAYIAVSYLIAHRMPAVALQNRGGRFCYPNLSNISNAASVVHGLPGNKEVHIVNPPRRAKNAYPISTFTYVIVKPGDPHNPGNDGDLRSFLSYAVGDGQSFGPRLDFVPLPKFIRRADLAVIGSI